MLHAVVLVFALIGLLGCAPGRDFPPPSADGQGPRPAWPQLTSPADDSEDKAKPKVLFQTETEGARGDRIEPVVEPGTGRLIGQPARPPARSLGEALTRDAAGDISLNVVDADIREVVRLVLEDGLNANYVIDPAVTGSITIRTSRPVPADDILSLLNAVLNANGAALVEQDDLFKIVPLEQAAVAGGRPDTRLTLDADGAGSGILVAPLRYIDAARLAELLQPFAFEGAIQLDAERNTLILTGSADQIATMSELIDMFDVDWMAGMSFGFYPLTAALPSDIAFELDQLFGRDEEEETSGDIVRFVPIDRLNALLVITAQPDYLQRAETWIERLDKVGEGDEEQIYVYSVQNGRATDLASVLGELFDIRSTAIGPELLLAPGLEPIYLGAPSQPDEAEPQRGDERSRERPGIGGRSRSDELSSFGQQDPLGQRDLFGPDVPLGQRELTEGREGDTTKIVADEGNNALLIRALPKDYKKIETALRELDNPPLQVLLEATIAEVTLENDLRYGIQWFFDSGSGDVLFSGDDNGNVVPRYPGFAGILSRGDVRVVIDALDRESDVEVISSPQLLVLDNQTAQLEVGDEVPVIVEQAEGFEEDSRLVNTVEQRQTGVILNVTPRVNANGVVVLDILQEVSDVVATTTSGIDSPTIRQRRAGTTVAVETDQTVALAGLIEDSVERVQVGVPVLSRLPLIGPLFGTTFDEKDRTELLILITPRVLNDTEAAVSATEELRKRLRAVQPLEAKIGRPYGAVEDDRGPLNRQTSETTPRDLIPSDRYFVVQLASVPTEAEAAAAWQAYESRYREELEGLLPRFEPYQADGEKGVSVRAGPLSAFAAADRICRRLKADGTDCLVVEKRQRPS